MGIVERFSPKQILGWVECKTERDREILFKVNGLLVAKTTACRSVRFNGELKDYGFARSLHALWSYLGEGDEFRIENANGAIPIAGHGTAFVPQPGVESKFPELSEKIKSGFVFDKRGFLTPSFVGVDKVKVFEVFDTLRAEIKAEFGYDLFPFYGTLLGCIREGDVIAHDNDFDFAYISRHRDRESVTSEFKKVCAFLIERNYFGVLYKHGFGIKTPAAFDIYYTWFNADGKFQTSFGYHGTEVSYSEDFLRFQRKPLGNVTVEVPLNSELILAQLYGDTWHIPNPGFSHYTRTKKFDQTFLLPLEELGPLHWKQVYRQSVRRLPNTGSLLAHSIAPTLGPDWLVVELGCGPGFDAVVLARSGASVVGLDSSDDAIDFAKRFQRSRKMSSIRFSVCDVTDEKALDDLFKSVAALTASDPKLKVMVVARRLFELVTKDAAAKILATITRACPDVVLATEFETGVGRPPPKTTAQFYLREIPADEFVTELEAMGFTTLLRTEGTGLAKTKEEDPHACRLVAVRGKAAWNASR